MGGLTSFLRKASQNLFFMKAPSFIVLFICLSTVNMEIFERVLFSRNFAYAKFRENEILAKWRNHSVVY